MLPDDIPVSAFVAEVDFWRSRYEALAARIDDPVSVQNAIDLVSSAARISNAAEKPFRQVFTSLLEVVYTDRPRFRRKKNK